MQITNSASTQQPRAKEKEEKERIDVGQCQVVESIGNQGKEQEEMAFSPFPFSFNEQSLLLFSHSLTSERTQMGLSLMIRLATALPVPVVLVCFS